MKKKLFFLLSIFLSSIFITSVQASQINPITLSELNEKSELIILAVVEDVKEIGTQDHVRISISSVLKGKTEKKTIELDLQVRGGLKDWDPILKKGETGVFFLKREINGYFRVAYPGSISIFQHAIYQ